MYPTVQSLPAGFRKLSVIVTEQEFIKLRLGASLSAHGTFSEAIRREMGLGPTPHRFIAAMKEQAEFEATNTDGELLP